MLGIGRDKNKSFFTPLGQEGMFERDKQVPPVEAHSPTPNVSVQSRPVSFTFHHGDGIHKVLSYNNDGSSKESEHASAQEAHDHATRSVDTEPEDNNENSLHEFGRDTTPPVGFISAGQ